MFLMFFNAFLVLLYFVRYILTKSFKWNFQILLMLLQGFDENLILPNFVTGRIVSVVSLLFFFDKLIIHRKKKICHPRDCPVQGQKLDFDGSCRSLPTQDIP